MKKVYSKPCMKVYKVNIADGILSSTSNIPVNPDDEGDAASRMDPGYDMGSSSKYTDLWSKGW